MKKKKFDVVILAGGKGTRLKKFTKNIPKPLIKIGKVPFLDILIQNITKYNLNKIYICAGYKGHKIKKRYHKKKINLIDIECIVENAPLGTGGCLSLLKNKISKNFFVINGDTFFDIDLNNIFYNNNNNNKIHISLSNSKTYKQNKKLTKLSLNKKKQIIMNSSSEYFNGGIYLMNKKILLKLKKSKLSLENDIIFKNINQKKVTGDYFSNFFLDIGTPKNLILANKILIKYLTKPAIFLDRDGTLVEDKGYVHKIKDFKIIDKTIDLIKTKNYYKFIVTNQSGIGRGYFSEKDFFNFQQHLKNVLYTKKIFIDDISYCPYIQNSKYKKYKKKSLFRKPGNLMISNLSKRYFINFNKSLMIGNTEVDKLCAKKSGLKYFDINQSSKTEVRKFLIK